MPSKMVVTKNFTERLIEGVEIIPMLFCFLADELQKIRTAKLSKQ
jgi:hypothetical protein